MCVTKPIVNTALYTKEVIDTIRNHFKSLENTNSDKLFLTSTKSEFDKLINSLINPQKIISKELKPIVPQHKIKKNKTGFIPREKIIIYGIPNACTLSQDRVEDSVKSFFREKLELDIIPKAASLISKKENSPIVVTLSNPGLQKTEIFNSCKKLQKFHNQGEKFSVQEFLNKKELKNRKLLMPIYKQLKQDKSNQVYFRFGKLYLNNKIYDSDAKSTAFECNVLDEVPKESSKRKIPLQRPPFPPPRPPLPLFPRTPSLISSKTNAEISSNTSEFSDNLSISSSKKSFSLKKTFNSFTRRNK